MGCCNYLVVQQQVCKTEHRGKFLFCVGTKSRTNDLNRFKGLLNVQTYNKTDSLSNTAYEISFMIEITEESL
jgi:hypothetical protein